MVHCTGWTREETYKHAVDEKRGITYPVKLTSDVGSALKNNHEAVPITSTLPGWYFSDLLLGVKRPLRLQ